MGAVDSERKGSVREPAVAGLFYPAGPKELRRDVANYLANAKPPSFSDCPPALIAPHAGYIYSGSIAAHAYACWQPWRDRIDCVAMLGPSHRVWFDGLALPEADRFRTPLGDVPVARRRLDRLMALPQVQMMDAAHGAEHSLEVHLPFLQLVLDDFAVIPLVVGEATAAEVEEVVDAVSAELGTVILISSDLSHYHSYDEACVLDERTCLWIEQLDWRNLAGEHACGCRGIAGLLRLADHRRWSVRTLDLRNSGDTAGDRRQVVGYGAWAFMAQYPIEPDHAGR